MRVDRSKVTVAGFGQRLELQAPDWPFLRTDTQWRLRRVYEPALAAALLPPEGMAVDIGAGFGGFALPFARAFPGWMVWCFEPEPEAHAALVANIAALGLPNVIALPVAVAGLEGAPADLGALAGGLAELAGAHFTGGAAGGADPAALVAACPRRVFRRSREKRGVLEAAPPGPGFEAVELPVLPALALGALAPDLVKLMAPFAEIPILEELAEVPLGLLLGESWTQVPSALMHGQAPGPRQCWLPLAGRPGLALRRQGSGGRPGLDVVVAMHDSAEWIADCVEGILASPSEEVRVVVVDDGSTDGSAELVQALWGGEPRVRLVSKPNGGCASARNYGRLMSDASHIAFVDADDAPGASLFSELLELARYTGAEVVQGGFELIHMEADGGFRIEPSYEAGDPGLLALPTEPFGAGVLRRVPAGLLITGQPTIWRRVYRRDFLDRRGIWFPEHIRAFDDQIFQLVTLQLAGEVPSVDHVLYGYRQHAGQDIRQGDARAFASLGMYRLVLRRALAEGWNDLGPLLASYVNTVNWSCGQLERGLRPRFVRAAAELWVVMRLALGEAAFAGLPETAVQVPDFAHYVAVLQGRLAGLPASHAWACLDSIEMHAPMVGTG